MRETLEREVKLRAGEAFELPELGGQTIEPRLFDSTYHDSRDHRLAQYGATLRHRVENGKGLWQLKLPRGVARLELELEGRPTRPPEKMLTLLPAYLRGAKLVPVARLRTRRTGVRVDGAEIVHDSVSVLDDDRVSRSFDELEVELIEGDEKALRRIEKALRRAGAGDGEQRPKVFQALDLEYEREPAAPAKDASTGEVLRAQLALQYERLLAHDPGTRLGTDPEDLHQFRVATRRLRAFLRAGRELLDPDWASPLREELRWLGGALGPVRDLDVLIERLSAEVDQLGPEREAGRPLVGLLQRRRRSARTRLRAALESERYFDLLDLLERPAPTVAEGVTLEQIETAEHRKLRKAIGALTDESVDAELHEARIKTKRARYAAELAADGAYVKAAKVLQDVLGEHQDAVVGAGRLRELAARSPDASLAVGRLLERELRRAAECRAEWPRAWKKLSRVA
ncbi:MAG: CYTH and CHAD domain-containing protein [Gaiellaceae bacterium MAG52_C11]|nr:CYTH and CHAD domain-containing protein [Candidatus Gaiellasilicea maunaloa]